MSLPASIPSPPVEGFHLGPLFVHAYGLCYVLATLAAMAIGKRRWRAAGGDPRLVDEVVLWGVPAGLVGGRLYYLATSWSEVPHEWWGPLAVWKGGLGIWGGIAGGVLAGIWLLHRRRADVPGFLDAGAPALLVAQAIGRVGNYFNQELFGEPTSLPWGLKIDRDHRPIPFASDTTFHPTFLYEMVWNVSLAGALVLLGRTGRVRAPGLFALYVAGYSLGRIGEELLRVDPAHHFLGLRLNFFVAVLLFAVGLAWLGWTQRAALARRLTRRHGRAALAAGALIGLGLCGCGHTSAPATSSDGGPGHVQPAVHAAQDVGRIAVRVSEGRRDGRRRLVGGSLGGVVRDPTGEGAASARR